jgi:hypothetical protein
MRYPQAQVRNRLRKVMFPQDRLRILPGFFPATAERNAPNCTCFACVDFDLECPFLTRCSCGCGVSSIDDAERSAIVVDHYGHPDFSAPRKQSMNSSHPRASICSRRSTSASPYLFGARQDCAGECGMSPQRRDARAPPPIANPRSPSSTLTVRKRFASVISLAQPDRAKTRRIMHYRVGVLCKARKD